MKLGIAAFTLALLTAGLPVVVQAQTYSRTEVMAYHDNTAKWVLGQVAKVTCTAPTVALPAGCGTAGTVISETTFDSTYARPLIRKSFGKVVQTLTYDTAATVASGQLGTVKTVLDGNSNITTLSNWKRGIPQSIKYPVTVESPAGASESVVVNDYGWISSRVDENGYKTCFGYDVVGRLASITYPSDNKISPEICNEFPWNKTTHVFEAVAAIEYGIAAGHWRLTTSTGNAKKITFYDAMWRPILTKELDATSGTTETLTKRFQRFTYDENSQVTFASYPGITDALTTGTWSEYDTLGRVTSVSQDSELGLLTTTTEYLAGAKARVTSPKGQGLGTAQQTIVSYMSYDQPTTEWPIALTHPEGAYTDITRDVFGKPTSLKRRDSTGSLAISRSYTYNANQELCRSVEPETGATLTGYDNAGNLLWSANGLPAATPCEATGSSAPVLARKAIRTYDSRNRIKTLVFPDGVGNTTHAYTPDGLPATITAQNKNSVGAFELATTSYNYNKRRLLTRETLVTPALNWPVDYVYNANGHLSSQNWHGLVIDYAPNALGQPTKAGVFASGVSYFPNGSIRQFTFGNGIVHSMVQNVRQLPSRSTDCADNVIPCATASKRLDLSYSFDKNANVGQITDNLDGRQTRGMVYDNLDRLTQTTSNTFGTAIYTYNVLDNLASVNVAAGNKARNHTYIYDTANRLVNVKNTVGGATVVGLGYDMQGNLANKNGVIYAFDYGNRMRSATNPITPNLTSGYAYDGLGRRVRDEVGTLSKHSMYLQNGQLSMTGDARTNKVTEYIYLQSSLVALRERDTVTNVYTTRYQHTDAHGTPIATTGANKAFLEKFEYEPFGQLVNSTLKDGPGYNGHVMDAATGLVQMQQRYYDPLLGRFLSVDPVAPNTGTGANFNRYAYASNNPFSRIDPDGRADRELAEYRKQQAQIHGTAQRSVNTPTHASTSQRIATAEAGKSGTQSAHLNQRLTTVTGNPAAPKIQPDVTVVQKNGNIDMYEVRSKGQTTAELNNKLTTARAGLGVPGRNIVVEPDVVPRGVGGGTVGAFGALGILQMIFHEYVNQHEAKEEAEKVQEMLEKDPCALGCA